MKTFIIKVSIFAVLFFSSAPIIIISNHFFSKKIDWKLPPHKHILFMGASHVEYGVNDSLTHSAINLAKSSERYMFTYIKLQHILKNNHQVDTIFLECASTDLFEHADDKYFKDNEMISFFATFYPLFNNEQWLLYKHKLTTAFPLLYRRGTIIRYAVGVDYKYFCDMFLSRTQTINTDSVYYKPVRGIYGNSINYKYLRKIIDLCNQKNIKIYFLYCPVYKPEYYYDQDYYYNAYKANFSDVELLDYSHYPVKDDERYDAHHLNHKGANKFTRMLKEKFKL